MFNVFFKTQVWMKKFAKKELENILNYEVEVLGDGFLKAEFLDENFLFDNILKLVYFSRTIENIYLEVDKNFKNNEFGFELINLNLSWKKVLVVDLLGLELTKRDFRINSLDGGINSLIYVYCLYLLGLDKVESDFSVIDPRAFYGDFIIEASLFNPRKALNIKKKNSYNFVKFLKRNPSIPSLILDKNKYVGLVQDNDSFKKIKENISFSSQKIKVSLFDLGWLDVKFKKGQFDYGISYFPIFDDAQEFESFQNEFFYMMEFVCKKKFCVVSRKEINEKFLRKYKLRLMKKKEIEMDKKKYFVYIIR